MTSAASTHSLKTQEVYEPSARSAPVPASSKVDTLRGAIGPLLVMFSGGRDSTLAALRLHRAGAPITLVTVTSTHLVGIQSVRQRLTELSRLLPPDTRWLQVRQPKELRTDISFYEHTCLPCHHAYVAASGVLAGLLGAHRLAFGYAGYQMDWPEQTPLAVARLAGVLARYEIKLELPVYDIVSRAAAIAELERFGLTPNSLEQKCLRQVTNVALPEARLRQQIELWEAAIDRSMQALDRIEVEIIAEVALGSLV
jgi:hypothetical protein